MATVIEILIDFSGSMKDKLNLTKETLLNLVIPQLDYSSRIGIKTFTSGQNKILVITPILPLNITNQEQLKEAVNSLGIPSGGTPIAESIRESVKSLSEFQAFDKAIVLVTDGEETNGGDPEAEVRNAQKNGVEIQIHTIGIGLSDKTKLWAEEIKKITKGSLSNIPYSKDTSYNQQIVQKNLSDFYSKISSSSTVIIPPIEINAQNVTLQQNSKTDTQELRETDIVEEPKNQTVEEQPITLNTIIDEINIIKEELRSIKSSQKQDFEIEEDPIINEKIRKASEEYLNEILKRKYSARVKWLNKDGESNQDHDFEIQDLDGSVEYFIECKGTSQNERTFLMTKNEWRLFLNNTKNYQIYFIKNISRSPSHIFIDNLFDWLLKGKIVPYSTENKVIKAERVLLTISETFFNK